MTGLNFALKHLMVKTLASNLELVRFNEDLNLNLALDIYWVN